jgi:hypothetical protein
MLEMLWNAQVDSGKFHLAATHSCRKKTNEHLFVLFFLSFFLSFLEAITSKVPLVGSISCTSPISLGFRGAPLTFKETEFG